MSPLAPKATTTSIRFSSADFALIEALRRKLGVSASSEILRMGLHALAAQHGVKA